MLSATNSQSESKQMCETCNDTRTVKTKGLVDVCPQCAMHAEIEYMVWVDHCQAMAEAADG